ncbi:hypothetical protein PoB_004546000 [Plakobranchus ocellatus]|uniref:Uncharacterized protein n=1 Tax=Plakobranchus ocellatus TaxID=259542 RepID=A0AAV4BEF3_9GAST|nr:hypothetical protein PoB_004546000 [Plakobranchus ocellatus]
MKRFPYEDFDKKRNKVILNKNLAGAFYDDGDDGDDEEMMMMVLVLVLVMLMMMMMMIMMVMVMVTLMWLMIMIMMTITMQVKRKNKVLHSPPTPWSDGRPETLRSSCCGLAIHKNLGHTNVNLLLNIDFSAACELKSTEIYTLHEKNYFVRPGMPLVVYLAVWPLIASKGEHVSLLWQNQGRHLSSFCPSATSVTTSEYSTV